MRIKSLAVLALTVAFLIGTDPQAFCQAAPAENGIKPAPATPSVSAKPQNKASKKTGISTIDEADFVTTTPEAGVPPPPVNYAPARATISTRSITTLPVLQRSAPAL